MAHFFVVPNSRFTGAFGCINMLPNELEEIVVPELDALGFECVKLEVVGSSRNPVVRLYIDKPGGVSVGDCSLVSRTVSILLDNQDPFPGKYLLEVSSPGSNRPLVKEEHFRRFEGDDARIQVMQGPDKITYTGRIGSCINGLLTLVTEEQDTVEIQLSNILKASLVGQEFKIDKKMKRPKREKRAGRSVRSGRAGTAKGEDQ